VYRQAVTKQPDALDVEDLTTATERTHVLEVELPEKVRAALQAEADRRGVTLEEFMRWMAMTAAAVDANGGSSSGTGTA